MPVGTNEFYNFECGLNTTGSGLMCMEWKEDVWKDEEIVCSMMQRLMQQI